MPHIVAVHTGAGNCSHETNKLLKILCKSVCSEVSALLAGGRSATDAAVAGSLLLEDSPLTNAGLGSSITDDKKTRTEASICSTVSGFHCAGDLENVRHPIKIVEMMARDTLENTSQYIPPRIMVGQSAIDRYSQKDAVICQTNICTKRSIKMFYKAEKYFNGKLPAKRRKVDPEVAIKDPDEIKKEVSFSESSKIASNHEKEEGPDGVEDTVGVVCIDSTGDITCATSSGGSVYKYSGRLGQCCTHGAGSYTTPSLGIVTTGNGEQIINKLIAVTVAHKLPYCTDPRAALDACFQHKESRMCGFVAVEKGEEGVATVHVQHTLTNMVVGFMSAQMEAPVVRVVTSEAPVFIETVRM
ncbi:threonine aspartase 1-like [Bolinopsis microptera]|uniref:threonine aspartase 1-like n=1 Tax=Bolinopsis microptera TaxID=2820187 RepID=UPI003079FF10